MKIPTGELLALTRRCFPWLIRSDEAILAVLGTPGIHIAGRYAEDRLIAVCAAHGETIYLLCVDRAWRGQGIGSALLAEAEATLRREGARGVQVGVGESYIAPGVPMRECADVFFRRRGYRHAWGDCGCFDMECDLAALPDFGTRLNGTREGVLYRLAGPEDLPLAVDCARDGHEPFAKYYAERLHYAPQGKEPVVIALAGGMAVGCLLMEIGTIAPDLGNVGCTVTRAAWRNRGIATTMVQAATAELKERGLKRAGLQYTYTDILPMYGRAGYRVSMEYLMARKEFCGAGA